MIPVDWESLLLRAGQPLPGPSFEARNDGFCVKDGCVILEGDPVAYVDDELWCEACVEPLRVVATD